MKVAASYDSMDEVSKKEFQEKHGGPMIIFIIAFFVMVLLCCCFFCGVCCFKDSLQRAIDVIDAAADFIAHNKKVIIVPNIHFVFMIIFTVIWIGAFLCVASLNKIKADPLIP